MKRFALLGLAVALGGCPSVIGADFDHPAAEGDAGHDAPAPISQGESDAGTAATASDAAQAPVLPQPSNGAAFGALPLGGNDLTLAASSTFDTSAECNPGSILGDCGPVVQAAGPAVCICRSGSLTIHDLTVTGTRGLVLLAHGAVTLAGTLDIAATQETGGPGAEPAPSTPAASGMFVHGTADLVPLRGGAAAIGGSNGGGALQISAGSSIAMKGTIQAGGGGGRSKTTFASGSGGSGGAILLEAPIVKVEGQLLANGGGGGGGAGFWKTSAGTPYTNSGGDGQDARAALRERALGGFGANGTCGGPTTSGGGGGRGGIEGLERTVGQDSSFVSCTGQAFWQVQPGGSGGGVGRIRINTSTSADLHVDPTAFVSPKISPGILVIQ